MPEIEAKLRRAVEAMHSGRARLLQVASVHERFEGAIGWDGLVHIFELKLHPQATRAYAWSVLTEASEERRIFAVLHQGSIKSPSDAVRAAIVAEHRS